MAASMAIFEVQEASAKEVPTYNLLIFADGTHASLQGNIEVLFDFQALCGLDLSPQKSIFFPAGLSASEIADLVKYLRDLSRISSYEISWPTIVHREIFPPELRATPVGCMIQ